MRPESATWLWDVLQAGGLIGQFVAGRDVEEYVADAFVSSAVERQMTIIGEALSRSARSDAQVQLTMPTFVVRSQPDAKDIAEKLGIVDLFGPAADLSGIEPGRFAGAFVHQAVVKADENGTEAAAASGVAIEESLPMIDLELVVDRPFLFWLSESVTGASLFLGAVTDPSDAA